MRRLGALGAALLLSGSAGAADVTPLWALQFMGGQHFFEGRSSALAGNIKANYTPAVKFSERWTLLPTYAGSYSGTRDVQELAGGGTLFQDSMSHGLLVKSVHRMGERWKLKPSAGAKLELLRETVDEKWGDGLFDYRKLSGGLEAEFDQTKSAGGRLAYDYYQLTFPNYESLESAADPTLARELAGAKVLDSSNHLITLGWWSPLPAAGRLDVGVFANRRLFGDQPVVKSDGGLTGTDRTDTTLSLNVETAYPFTVGDAVRAVGTLGLSYGSQSSNQNHFDARKAVFLSNYYDYSQWSLAPQVSAAFGESKWVSSLSASYQRRTYSKRPTQDGNGDYLSEKLSLSEITTQFAVTYPVAKNMRLRFQTSLAWSDSNMQYEKVFRYNYKIANYMMGFSYDY